jgi:glycosyltransferase involved in cell wall biosynthesis
MQIAVFNFRSCCVEAPFVSTTIGAEGIDLINEKEVILRDLPQDFSDAVVKCLLQKKVRKELADNAFNFVKNKYDWSVLAEAQKKVWLKLHK